MKMKQKLAATLAGVMAMSMVPVTSAFAASAETYSQKILMAQDKVIKENTLVIRTDRPLEKGQSIFLTLSGDPALSFSTKGYSSWAVEESFNSAAETAGNTEDIIGKAVDVKGNVYNITGKTLYFTYNEDTQTVADKKDGVYEYTIPYAMNIQKKAGTVTLTVDGNNTAVRDAAVTVLEAVSGTLPSNIGTNVYQLVEEGNDSYVKVNDITISETVAMTIAKNKAYTFKITSSSTDFTWVPKDYIKDYAEADDDWVDVTDILNKGGMSVNFTKGLEDHISACNAYLAAEGSELWVTMFVKNEVRIDKGDILVSGLRLYKNEELDNEFVGEINVSVKGEKTGSKTVVAELTSVDSNGYANAKATKKSTSISPENGNNNALGVTANTWKVYDDSQPAISISTPAEEKTTTLYRGLNDQKTAVITIKEEVFGSVIDDIIIEVPEGVKITSVKDLKTQGDKGLTGKVMIYKYNGKKEVASVSKGLSSDNTMAIPSNQGMEIQKIGLEVDKVSSSTGYRPVADTAGAGYEDDKLSLSFELGLSVSADYKDDYIYATISTVVKDDTRKGEDIEQEVLLAKVADRFEVETEVNSLASNSSKQSIADITIKETAKGQLTTLKTVALLLPEGMTWAAVDKNVEVVSGDIKLDEVERDGRLLTFKVRKASTKASEIKITGLKVKTSNISDGLYDIRLTGDAVTTNDIYLMSEEIGLVSLNPEVKALKDTKLSKYLTTEKTITTDEAGKTTTTETVKSAEIDEDSADAIAENTTNYYAAAKMLSVLAVGDVDVETTKPSTKVETEKFELSVNASTYVVNGEARPLLAKPYVKVTDPFGNGDVMVPVRAIAEMLGFQVDWVDGVTTFTSADGRYAQWRADAKEAITVEGRNHVLRYAPALSEKENVDGATFVWLRDLTRVLGVADDAVVWNGDGTITVTATVAK